MRRDRQRKQPETKAEWRQRNVTDEYFGHTGWKKPYFLPVDHTIVVVCGMDSSAYFEIDLADIFEVVDEQLGVGMKAGFWETVIDWNDRNASFGELVRKLTTGLNAGVRW